MAILLIEALPHKTTRGTIVRLLIQVGNLDKGKIGTIELESRRARIEVPDNSIGSVVKRIDGTTLGTQNIRASVLESKETSSRDQDHFDKLTEMLELEADAEAEQLVQLMERASPQEVEQQGTALIRLNIVDMEPGLGGRLMVKLVKASKDRLPWTRLGVGAPVVLTAAADDVPKRTKVWRQRGVIASLGARVIELAIEGDLPETDSNQFRIDLSFDEVARKRQRAALQRAKLAQSDRLSALRRVLVDGKLAAFGGKSIASFKNDSLNESQRDAIEFALGAEDLAIIHGPPGTGKTTALVELICQAIDREEAVLACAPSNLAVDNLFERLLRAGVRAVRIGHPARVSPELRENTLDLLVDAHPDMKLAKKFAKEALTLRERASRFTRAKPQPGERREMREEARDLIGDAKRLEAQVVESILDKAQVICATATGIDSELLGKREFDLLVLDEACQTTEPACWIPLQRASRLVLAGDHCQLPPTVISQAAAKQGYAVSMQERLIDLHGESISKLLEKQYRMHEQIMTFSNDEFYDGRLSADETVKEHVLANSGQAVESEFTTSPLCFIDTAGAGWVEESDPNGESRRNPNEADLVIKLVHWLTEARVEPDRIGVITPYSAQVRLLREREELSVEVDTVDGFQGREKDAIIISLVRSNEKGDIGFLKDLRRMNVAMTRARQLLVVVGDSSTIASDPFYQRLLAYFEEHAAYRTVWEEPFC